MCEEFFFELFKFEKVIETTGDPAVTLAMANRQPLKAPTSTA